MQNIIFSLKFSMAKWARRSGVESSSVCIPCGLCDSISSIDFIIFPLPTLLLFANNFSIIIMMVGRILHAPQCAATQRMNAFILLFCVYTILHAFTFDGYSRTNTNIILWQCWISDQRTLASLVSVAIATKATVKNW